MHQFQVAFLLVLSTSTGADNFVDPTDLFNIDQTNLELSKKPGRNDEKYIPEITGHEDVDSQLPHVTESSNSDSPNRGFRNDLPVSESNKQKDNTKASLDNEESCKVDKIGKAAIVLFQQFVMRVVHHSQQMVDDSYHPVEFCLRVKATQHDLADLRKFGEGNDAALHVAHEKLSNLIQSASALPEDGPVIWLENWLGLSRTVLSLVALALLTFFLILKALLSVRLTSSKVWLAILAVFVASVAFTWLEMYQKKVADRERLLSDSMAVQCPQYEKLNMWERFSYYVSSSVTFQDENCREYFEALFVNPASQVSPLEAMAVAAVKTFVSPLKIIGEGIKGFITGLFKDLPLQFATFLLMSMSVLVILIPFMAFGYTIRVPFILSIEPRSQPKALSAKEIFVHKPIEELGQGDALPHEESMKLPSSQQPQVQRGISLQGNQRILVISSRTKTPTAEIKSNLQTGRQNVADAATSPHSIAKEVQEQKGSSDSATASDQTAGVQVLHLESKDRNDSSQEKKNVTHVYTPLSSTAEKPKQVATSPESDYILEGCYQDDLLDNFIDLQHSDCEESYIELVTGDFNEALVVQNSKQDDGVQNEEEQLISCSKKEKGEKDLTGLNVRGT